jgi:hypothetical protein
MIYTKIYKKFVKITLSIKKNDEFLKCEITIRKVAKGVLTIVITHANLNTGS